MTYVYRANNIPICNFPAGSARAIYVPDNKLEEWKTTTGWTNHVAYLKPLSEYIE